MTLRANPALSCAAAGPISAAISPNHALHQACNLMTRGHPIKPCRKKRLAYTARRHVAVCTQRPTPQP
jgi:hypothetical protein